MMSQIPQMLQQPQQMVQQQQQPPPQQGPPGSMIGQVQQPQQHQAGGVNVQTAGIVGQMGAISGQLLHGQDVKMAPPQHDIKMENISKVKSLIWPLKESLAVCMRVAAANIQHNASVDAGGKGADTVPSRFDKSLEEFYSICDQVELNLKVALDCSNLVTDSQRYTPFTVAVNKPDLNIPDSHSYNQLFNLVKMQVEHAKEIHDHLTNAARTIELHSE